MDVYQIPYRCLLPRETKNLIMGAGRSISAENPFLLRVMASTMTVGQGAGTAAAVCARSSRDLHDADIPALQGELIRQGVVFDN